MSQDQTIRIKSWVACFSEPLCLSPASPPRWILTSACTSTHSGSIAHATMLAKDQRNSAMRTRQHPRRTAQHQSESKPGQFLTARSGKTCTEIEARLTAQIAVTGKKLPHRPYPQRSKSLTDIRCAAGKIDIILVELTRLQNRATDQPERHAH